MSFNAIGDLASSMMRNQANLQAMRNIARFSEELTTGITSDIPDVLRSDLSQQIGWEHTISSAKTREKTLSEAIVKVQMKQAVTSSIGDSILSVANDLNLASSGGLSIANQAISTKTDDSLKQVLAQLNTQTSGRYLFSGASTNSPAMASFDEIMGSVELAVTGATTVLDITQRVQDWMDDPVSGFSTVAYLGSTEDSSPIRTSNDSMINEKLKANDEAFEQGIQQLILISVALNDELGLSEAAQTSILDSAADGLRTAESSLTERTARLGQVEAELSKAKTRANTEISTAESVRAETLSVDQYEVASQLQQAELQLERIYMLTARSARLSLLEYLR